MIKIYSKTISTPIGNMFAVATRKGICMLEFEDKPGRIKKHAFAHLFDTTNGSNYKLDKLESELNRYFNKKLKEFTVPLDLAGTEFQVRVWESLLDIPYGNTRTYGQQAEKLGDTDAVRAVASANGRNPISIIVPCHRVIGSDGKLTGYGGGLWRKQFLLELESKQKSLF